MIPIRDVNPTRRTAVVTIFFIGMNVSVFLIAAPLFADRLVEIAATPQRVLDCNALLRQPGALVDCGLWSIWRSIFNSMFLHISPIHIAFNMFTLWLFGNNVEDRLGRIRFVGFYLASGLAATYFYVFLQQGSPEPLVGASGAVAACIGAYLLMFPRAHITTLSISFGGRRELRKMMNEGPAGATKSRLFSIAAVDIPAWVFAIFYFVVQLSQNALGWVKVGPAIAYEAHIGGFLAGMLALLVLAPQEIHPSVRRLFRPGARSRERADGAAQAAAPRGIIERTGRRTSVTQGWRALELFTDRTAPIRLFAGRLNDDPPAERILFFHGDGGNGKSLLLRHLAERCTVHHPAERWTQIRDLPDEQLEVALAQGGKPVPYAMLDFGAQPRGDDRPQEAFSGLLMLRRALADPLRAFPLFDFACVHYLHAMDNASPERLKMLFPNEERSFIASVADIVGEQHWVADAALEMITRRIGTSFDAYMKRRKLDAGSLETIEQMDPRTELIDELPRLFAQDLNAAMALPGAPPRLALFFDGHESFWGGQRGISEHLYFERDEWLRRLLGELDLRAGIVCVVAGREPPRWARATEARIPGEFTDVQLLGHLSESDALAYLARAGIEDPALRMQLAAHARIDSDQIHPLYLGLCADLALAAQARGAPLGTAEISEGTAVADEGSKLVSRLLRYVDPEVGFAVGALSAARAFDRDLYSTLGAALGFQSGEPSFDALTGLSFVWFAEGGRPGFYRIHPLLRRLAGERGGDALRRADTALEHYYRERAGRGDAAAHAEAIYHASKTDLKRGTIEWLSAFGDALALNRFDECRTLLDVRRELTPDGEAGRAGMARAAGDFFARLARYREAQAEYEEAVAAYERAVISEPAVADHHRRKGDVLRRICELQARLSRHAEAMESYRRAIGAYEDALALAPDDVRVRRSQANAMRALGDVQARLSRNDEALATYEAAVAASGEVLRRAPGDPRALNQRGVVLRGLGDLRATLGRKDEALTEYEGAITALEEALKVEPGDVEALNNSGIVHRSIGDLKVATGAYAEGTTSYASAIAAYDEALRVAPDYLYAHNNKGTAFRSLGASQAGVARHDEALGSYAEAILAYEAALRLGPDYMYAHNNRGTALSLRGRSQAALGRNEEAVASLTEALAAFDSALGLAPDYVHAHTNKGMALATLGNLHAESGRHEPARACYGEAVAAFDRALEIAPGNELAHAQREAARRALAKTQFAVRE